MRYFIAVAEEGSFGGAALRVHVTQPPVTRQIHALEQELGVTLFVRTPRGAVLTEAGRVFLEEAREIVDRAHRAGERSRAADRGEIGRLTVAFFGSSIYQAVPMILRRFRALVPQAQVTLVRMGKDRQHEALRSGEIDVGFSRYFNPAPDIEVVAVAEEPLFVALPVEDSLASATSLRLGDLTGRALILFPSGNRPSFADAVLNALAAAEVKLAVAAEAEDQTSALALVSIGAGICITPQSVTTIQMPGVAFIRLSDPGNTAPTHCAYLKNNKAPIFTAFMRSLGERTRI
ncbi:LysR family transcriptional regulator [Sphingomonas fennica]|uniref:LysR family transcriptional regulator n=1 Tax=Edaphosphingomonas fennica TaxID=114404 RepID=UPI001474DDE6|nr:LysR family transcriptional regulator [Sphingomonas fennica]